MKQYFLNNIDEAISQGIDLGIKLYDGDIVQDIEDEVDLSQPQKTFKPIELYQNMDYAVKWYLEEKKFTDEFFQELCLNYNNSFYKIYHIRNEHGFLRKLILRLCHDYGFEINLNWIDVSQVENMQALFYKVPFKGDISLWDVSNVQDMSMMFANSAFNGDISKWDVSNVENMSFMFFRSEFNGDISQWDVSNVENMDTMFYGAAFNQDISTWRNKHVIFDDEKFQWSPLEKNKKFRPKHIR